MLHRRWLAWLATALITGLALPDAANAQGLVRLAFSPPTVAFPPPGVADFDAGWIEHGALVVSVESRPLDRPWELTIRAGDAAMGSGKPVSHLQWRMGETGGWTPLSAVDALVLRGNGDQDIPVEFRLQLDWATDPPGSYTAGIAFTITRL